MRPVTVESISFAFKVEKQSSTVEHYRKEMELMRKQLEAKGEVNMMLANEISNTAVDS